MQFLPRRSDVKHALAKQWPMFVSWVAMIVGYLVFLVLWNLFF